MLTIDFTPGMQMLVCSECEHASVSMMRRQCPRCGHVFTRVRLIHGDGTVSETTETEGGELH